MALAGSTRFAPRPRVHGDVNDPRSSSPLAPLGSFDGHAAHHGHNIARQHAWIAVGRQIAFRLSALQAFLDRLPQERAAIARLEPAPDRVGADERPVDHQTAPSDCSPVAWKSAAAPKQALRHFARCRRRNRTPQEAGCPLVVAIERLEEQIGPWGQTPHRGSGARRQPPLSGRTAMRPRNPSAREQRAAVQRLVQIKLARPPSSGGATGEDIPLPIPKDVELPIVVKFLPQTLHYVENRDTQAIPRDAYRIQTRFSDRSVSEAAERSRGLTKRPSARSIVAVHRPDVTA